MLIAHILLTPFAFPFFTSLSILTSCRFFRPVTTVCLDRFTPCIIWLILISSSILLNPYVFLMIKIAIESSQPLNGTFIRFSNNGFTILVK